MSSSKVNILVTEAHAVGPIAAIRSLGRAGFRVHTMSQKRDALGFCSTYAFSSTMSPAYTDKEFIKWFRNYLVKQKIEVIIPSEGLLLALKPFYKEFESLLALNTRAEHVYEAFSKHDILKRLTEPSAPVTASRNLPPTLFINPGKDFFAEKALSSLKPPYFLKADGCHGIGHFNGLVDKIQSEKDVSQYIINLNGTYTKAILQGFVEGIDVGVYFLIWEGQVVAEFMNRSIHSVPHTGGFYALRESWKHKGIRDDALAKLRHIAWEGVAMMEYRWDPVSDSFCFIELNARFWGSLHHAIFAGVDFPKYLVELFRGKKVFKTTEFPQGLKCRYTFPLEVQYVASRLKDKGLSSKHKMLVILEFFYLFFDWRIVSDLWFPKDRKLYLINFLRFIRSLS